MKLLTYIISRIETLMIRWKQKRIERLQRKIREKWRVIAIQYLTWFAYRVRKEASFIGAKVAVNEILDCIDSDPDASLQRVFELINSRLSQKL